MTEEMKKAIKCAIESKFGHVDDETFREAFDRATRKQARIFANTGKTVILKNWYLRLIVEEELKSLEMEKFTLNLYQQRQKEKCSNFNTLSIENLLNLHQTGIFFPIVNGEIIGAFICLE